MDHFWGEIAPNWIEAVSTAVALLAAGAVAYFGWKQYRIERSRDSRHRAFGLSAWWAIGEKPDDESKAPWGVVVSNTSDAVFYNLTVFVEGARMSADETSFKVRTFPPGRCFVESSWTGPLWNFARAVGHSEEFTPVFGSKIHHIKRLTYSDTATRSWEWTPDGGLREVRTAVEGLRRPRIASS